MSGGAPCGGGSCGIQRVREAERERAARAVIDAHPELRWGSALPGRAVNVSLDELARDLEAALPTRAFVARAEPDGLADWVYLLVGLHEPALWELREETRSGEPSRTHETYLRVGISPFGPFATLQECAFEIDGGDPTRVVAERPALGVTDGRLRSFVTVARGLLGRSGLALLDVAFLVGAPPGPLAQDATFQARFGTAPTLWSFLFEPSPPTTTRESIVRRRAV